MATTTTNLGLTLPVGSENVSRQILNDNFQKIDDGFGDVYSLKNFIQIAGTTASTIQDNLLAFANTMADGEICSIYFSPGNSDPFDSTTYIGTIATKGSRIVVNVHGISGLDQDMTGFYKSDKGWSWESFNRKLTTQEALAEFTGTSSQSISLSKSADKYVLLTVRVFNSSGEVCGVATAPPALFKNLTYKIFGESSSQWGSFLLANDFASAIFNRTSANTQKISVYGVMNV